jgi:signal transduction histidine kinase
MMTSETFHNRSVQSNWRNVILVALLTATFISFIYSVRNVFGAITLGRKIDWAWSAYYQFVFWYLWAALVPLIVWFARRFDADKILSPRTALALLAFGLFIATAQAAIENLIALAGEHLRHVSAADIARQTQQLRRSIFLEIFPNYIIYLTIVAAHYGYDYYRRYRDRQLRSVELEVRLTRAELQSLKMQLHPHFLFNTLNAISVLMMRDTETANRMLLGLSDLLRLTLDEAGAQEVSLKHELEILNLYLAIEKMRFQDRLEIGTEIQPQTLDAVVPNLILQPLVENAIRHGVARKTGVGRIDIRAKREGTNLCLEVQDNGPGLRGLNPSNTGIGLANSRARLQRLYGSNYRLEITNSDSGGVLSSVVIPFRLL